METAKQHSQSSQESASRLLDGFAKYAQRDYAGATEILQPLAKQGDAAAQQLLGSIYSTGEGVPQDKFRAAQWFSLAAKQGNVDAQFALGLMYRDGAGVPKSHKFALQWLGRAAQKHHSEAANAAGELCVSSLLNGGDGQAWFEYAALMGNETALYHLGMAALARGGEHGDTEAYKWFALSAEISLGATRDIAERAVLVLRERMMPLQVEAAKRFMHDWISLRDSHDHVPPDLDCGRDLIAPTAAKVVH